MGERGVGGLISRTTRCKQTQRDAIRPWLTQRDETPKRHEPTQTDTSPRKVTQAGTTTHKPTQAEKTQYLAVGVLFAYGLSPQLEWLRSVLRHSLNSYVLTYHRTTTNRASLFIESADGSHLLGDSQALQLGACWVSG